jgi:hypothetical protein
MDKPREEVEESSDRFLVVEKGLMGVFAMKLSLDGVFMGDLLKRTDDFLAGQVRGAPLFMMLSLKKMPISEFSLSSSSTVRERSNSELVGVSGMLLHSDEGGRAYLEGVRAGVYGFSAAFGEGDLGIATERSTR